MPSPSPQPSAAAGLATGGERGPAGGTVGSLLDAAFGFFVWMAHLLTIYIAAALACGLGLVGADGRSPAGLRTALVVATVVAAVVVALHAARRWRQQRARPNANFRMSVTLGCDAIATVGIVWQLLAIGLVPACV